MSSLTRREFLTQTGTGMLAAATLGRLQAAGKPVGQTSRPNILYVILEDCGPQFGCYGEPLVLTPNLDRFASQGIRFTNAFCSAPVCSASRSALMTGCYQTSIGCHHHRTWAWNRPVLPPPVAHVCDWFRSAGYFTCNLQPPGGKKKGVSPREQLNGALGAGKIDLNFLIDYPKKGDPFDGYDWSQRKPGQPFFAHITIMETHKGPGWEVARELPAAELVNPDRVKLASYYPDHPVARDEYANYLDAVHLSDRYVGELLARLEREGLADNTIVVISSDHGPLFRGKQFLYDNGLRIPLLMRFPGGHGAATVDGRMVSGIDLAPTMLGFAGVTPPAGAMQGIDFLAPGGARRDHVFAARDRMDISIDRMRAVRTERFKYIRNYLPAVPYMQHNPYKERAYPTWNLVKQLHREKLLSPEADLFAAEVKPIEELFDLAADPAEVRNLARDPAHLQTLRELRERVDAWVKLTDRGTTYEDPVDIYHGYWGHLPGEGDDVKTPANS